MDDVLPGRWYVKACGCFSREDEEETRRKMMEEAKRHISALQNIDARASACRGDAKAFSRMRRLAESENRQHEKTRRRILQPDYSEAVYYLGMDITPKQSIGLASVVSACAFLLFLFLYVFLLRISPGSRDFLSSYVLPGVFAVPLLFFAFLSSYPEALAKRVQAMSIGKTPEPINYMTMSLRTSPSLERAVLFAGEHCDEPMASHLKRIVWDVMVREHNTIEDSLSSFAYRFGMWNEELRRSLYMLRSAVLEKTRDGFERGLEKAHDIAITGTKEKVESFASRLSGPATVLFALGVVLPMMVGAMIPMQGLQTPMSSENGSGGSNDVLPIVFAMNVVFPLVAFIYTYNLLGKRPGTMPPPRVLEEKQGWHLSAAILVGALPLMLYFTGFLDDSIISVPSVLSYENIGHIPVLLSIALGLGTYFFLSTKSSWMERKRLLSIEKDLPDALFQLGSRISEGMPLEAAFDASARTMDTSPIAPLFREVSVRMGVHRQDLESVLFSKDGVIQGTGSRSLSASMRTLLEAVKKDSASAGKTIIQMANYMKDLKKVDHDIKVKLQGVVDMMRATSLFFAPLVMGMTVALYSLLAAQFVMLGGDDMLATRDFAMILGVYLLLSSLVSAYFVTGIGHGGDRLTLKRNVGMFLPVSIIIFFFAVVAGQVFVA